MQEETRTEMTIFHATFEKGRWNPTKIPPMPDLWQYNFYIHLTISCLENKNSYGCNNTIYDHINSMN